MPLRGVVDGVELVSCLLEDQEWLDLKLATRKRAKVPTLQCGHPAVCKTSSLGTKFFAHARGTAEAGCPTPESPQHILLKGLVVQTAVAVGWGATPEAIGDGWRADVLLEHEGRRLAVEIQWTEQTPEIFKSRQERYEAAGIECIWLYRVPRGRPMPYYLRSMPVLSVTLQPDGQALCRSTSESVAKTLVWILGDSLRWRKTTIDQANAAAQINIYRRPCRCGAWMVLWYMPEVQISCECDELAFDLHPDEFMRTRPEASPMVVNRVKEATQDWRTPHAEIRPTYTRASGTTYAAFNCPTCSAVQGEVFLIRDVWDYPPQRVIPFRHTAKARTHAHWCGPNASTVSIR